MSLLVLTACQSNTENAKIAGEWSVCSNYYKATCSIEKEDGFYNMRVVHYNDGTSIYASTPERPIYLFKGLLPKNDAFVDGHSGATQHADLEPNISLQLLSKDTLLVKQKMTINQLNREIWIRKQ